MMKIPEFRKYPSGFTLIPLALGIALCYYSPVRLPQLSYNIYYFLLPGILIASVILYSRLRKTLSLSYILFSALVFMFGYTSMHLSHEFTDENNISRNAEKFRYSNVNLYGRVTDEADSKDDRIRFIAEIDSLSRGVEKFYYHGQILITVYQSRFSHAPAPKLSIDDKIEINGRLEPLPGPGNPGEFDYGTYLKLHDIDAVFTSSGYENVKSTSGGSGLSIKKSVVQPVKDYINGVIDTYSAGDEREFLRGLTLGDKSNITKETKDNFINAGVAHIIAVSGLNVAYVLIVISGLLLIVPIKRDYKNIIIIAALLFYMLLTGSSPSIVRATIMAIVFLLSQFFERKPDSYNVISFAALVILVIDPRQLFDAGFILSFSALTSLIYFTPKLISIVNYSDWYKNLDPRRRVNKLFKNTVLLFMGTLAAQLGTLPVTAIMFKKISVVSLGVNLFAIPVSNLSLGLGFVTVIFSLFSSWLASVFAALNNFIMYYLIRAIALAAHMEFAFVETYRMDILLFAAYYVILFLLFSLRKKNYKTRIALVVLVAANFIVYESILSANTNAKLTYLDIRNSNSTLIQMPGGTNILINAGTSNLLNGSGSAGRNIIPYLKREGISKIDLLVITAANAEEIVNLRNMLNRFDVSRVLLPVYYRPLFDNNVVKRQFAGRQIDFVDSSTVINRKGSFRIYLYYDGKLHSDAMLAELRYGEKRFVFCDDEDEVVNMLNAQLISSERKISVLRVPRFGSFDFTPPEFIMQLNPSLIVVPETEKRYYASSDVFEETLNKFGFAVKNVSKTGALILETDGEKIKIVK
jgi:competence protein ComEC